MAKLFFLASKDLTTNLCLLLIALILGCANSSRILDEVTPQDPLPAGKVDDNPDVAPVATAPAATLPSGQLPATVATPAASVAPAADETEAPAADVADNTPATPVTGAAPLTTTPAVPSAGVAGATVTPVTTTPAATSAGGPDATGASTTPDHATLSFFMHDILGGSHPSGRVVTGVVANTDVNHLPFANPVAGQVFPLDGGVPLNTINDVIDNNNYPFLVGLNGAADTLTENNGNNDVLGGGGNQPFVTAGNLPSGLTLQQLMFGSITVVDDQLTEGYELGTAVIGRAQGFYLASSQDGSSHTLALTALFHGGEHHEHEVEDTISFFGVHRTATPVSHLAVIGGTGKYENAKGYATIETDLHHVDQHTTDGVETITHFTVYLTP